jgi:hypothetical protein
MILLGSLVLIKTGFAVGAAILKNQSFMLVGE